MLIVWFDVSIDASKTPTWLIFETGNAVISNRFLSGFFTLLATYGAVRTVLQYASRSYKKHSRTAEYEALAEKLKEWPRAAQDFQHEAANLETRLKSFEATVNTTRSETSERFSIFIEEVNKISAAAGRLEPIPARSIKPILISEAKTELRRFIESIQKFKQNASNALAAVQNGDTVQIKQALVENEVFDSISDFSDRLRSFEELAHQADTAHSDANYVYEAATRAIKDLDNFFENYQSLIESMKAALASPKSLQASRAIKQLSDDVNREIKGNFLSRLSDQTIPTIIAVLFCASAISFHFADQLITLFSKIIS